MKNILWKVYFLLLLLSLAGAAGILPYSAELTSSAAGSIPPGLMLLATFMQTFLMAAVMGFFGLRLSLSTGLGVPVIENLLYKSGGKPFSFRNHVLFAVAAGIVCGLLMVIMDLALIELFNLSETMSASGSEAAAPAWWKGLLASFYGGISEEIMMRLFTMNLIIYIFNAIDRNHERKTSIIKVIFAMVISSIIFGIGHLAAAFASGLSSPEFIARTLILNFVPGMIFGWIYWKKSFLTAMAAHFTTDIVVHAAARFILDNLPAA